MLRSPVNRYVFWLAQMALYRLSETCAAAYERLRPTPA